MSTSTIIDSAIDLVGALPDLIAQTPAYLLATIWLWLPAVVIGAGALTGFRALLVRRALRSRVSYDLLPTTSFDPKPEEILRFAQHLSHAQRAASRWRLTPRRGLAMRVLLTSEGGLTMRIEGPATSAAVLRHQVYAGCEVRSVERSAPGDSAPDAPAPIRFPKTPLAPSN
ncbi:hypothetical protein [Kitasatospora sp. MBT63]|uniref:hypothetical protein n=1 Tax=Kitasatospora sp. MBT63 TaxID=1444768 RepID=UPI000691F728|nr:hypothetical protein [Kitasatospora sp. MBT63]